jgi:hypothetical protein
VKSRNGRPNNLRADPVGLIERFLVGNGRSTTPPVPPVFKDERRAIGAHPRRFAYLRVLSARLLSPPGDFRPTRTTGNDNGAGDSLSPAPFHFAVLPWESGEFSTLTPNQPALASSALSRGRPQALPEGG